MPINHGKESRIYTLVTKEFYDNFSAWADRLGVTKSVWANICIQAGMSAVIRTIAPEEVIKPEQWRRIFEGWNNPEAAEQLAGAKKDV